MGDHVSGLCRNGQPAGQFGRRGAATREARPQAMTGGSLRRADAAGPGACAGWATGAA